MFTYIIVLRLKKIVNPLALFLLNGYKPAYKGIRLGGINLIKPDKDLTNVNIPIRAVDHCLLLMDGRPYGQESQKANTGRGKWRKYEDFSPNRCQDKGKKENA